MAKGENILTHGPGIISPHYHIQRYVNIIHINRYETLDTNVYP